MRIVVLGYIVRAPLGGLAWHHLQYILGLKQLGHQVLFLEDSDDFDGCYNPDTSTVTRNPEYGLKFLKELFAAFGLNDNWAYFDAHTNSWFGLSKKTVFSFCEKADVVLNVSVVNPLRDWWIKIPKRVLIDTDPGFTQIKHLTELSAKMLALHHNHFFSFAENINNPDCTIPSDGIKWQPTRQPVFLNAWEVSPVLSNLKWTTVMQWDSYKTREYNGQFFGMKSLSFNDYFDLPQLASSEIFEIAMGSSTAPREQLLSKGWNIISSLIPTRSPWSYQDYIHNSKGEWSIAKHGYVTSNSGWFSERTLCYMACGKPALIQDTGISNLFETGLGLLIFSNIEEAIEGIKKVNSDYKYHCKKSRHLVEEHFDAAKVLKTLLNHLI